MNKDLAGLDWLAGIQAVSFDKDGTFINFDRTWGGALNRVIDDMSPEPELCVQVAAMLGFDRAAVTFDPHSTFVGGSQDVYGPRWAELLGLPYDEAFIRSIADAFERHVFDSLAMIDGAGDALRAVSGMGLPMSVATNDAIRATLRQLDHLALTPLFDFVAGYDSGHGPKPGGGMLRAFLERRGIPAHTLLMVGDSINDALAAREVGARMIGLETGPEAHPEFEGLCDLMLPSIRELPPLLAAGRS